MVNTVRNWLQKHVFQAYVLVFFLMVLPAAGLYFAAQQFNLLLVWILLGLFLSGNLLALVIPRG